MTGALAWPQMLLCILLGLLGGCGATGGLPQHYAEAGPGLVLSHEFYDGTCTGDEYDRFLAAYGRVGHTPLMAIGDSLYNGVQALHVDWWLAEWSAPALVAMRLGLIGTTPDRQRSGERSFIVPPYPGHPVWAGGDGLPTRGNRPITYGLDVETISAANFVADLLHRRRTVLQDEAQALLDLMDRKFLPADRPAGLAFADNLAFEGSIADDMAVITPAGARLALSEPGEHGGPSILDRLKRLSSDPKDLDAAVLADAFYFINADFVLNPLGLDCLKEKSALQQVLDRKPDRVLVSLGSNHGIYKVAFKGDPVSYCSTKGHGTIAQDLADIYPYQMAQIMHALADGGIGHVYMNALAQPSFIANLTLGPGERPVGVGNYYRGYGVNFSIARRLPAGFLLPGREVRTADETARLANRRLLDAMRAVNAGSPAGRERFVVVPVDRELAAFDFKHSGRPEDSVGVTFDERFPFSLWSLKRAIHLTNLPLAVPPTPSVRLGFDPKFNQGGLFSFDNMHLSTFGYNLLAEKVAGAIAEHEGIPLLPTGVALTEPDNLFHDPGLARHMFMRNADSRASLNRLGLDAAVNINAPREFAARLVDRSQEAGVGDNPPCQPPAPQELAPQELPPTGHRQHRP